MKECEYCHAPLFEQEQGTLQKDCLFVEKDVVVSICINIDAPGKACAQGRKPDLGMFGILLAVYILLLGPGLYVFLKRRSLSVWYFRSAAVLSAAASILFYALGARTRFRDTFYTYALVRDVSENAVSDTAYLSLRNPGSEAYSVQVAEGFQLFPLTGAEGQEESGRRGTEDRIGVTIEELSSGSRITVRSAGAFSPRMFRMNRSAARGDDQGFSGSISLFEDEYSGKVKNRNPFPVEQAFVLTFGKIIPLGTIGPGETVDLIGRPLYRIPLNDSYTVAAFLTGVYDVTADQESRLEALERANFLSFYLKDELSDYSADARIIGFAAEQTGDRLLTDEALQSYGSMLITATVPVDSRKDGLVFRSVLSRTPEVLSGDYIADTNSFYPGEPVVLGYLADPDISIRTLIFEEADPVFENGDSEAAIRSFSGRSAAERRTSSTPASRRRTPRSSPPWAPASWRRAGRQSSSGVSMRPCASMATSRRRPLRTGGMPSRD